MRLTIYVALFWLLLGMIRSACASGRGPERHDWRLLFGAIRGHASVVAQATLESPRALSRRRLFLICEVGVLLSMTGFGEARYQSDRLNLSIELRSVNNRYLKIAVRAPDPMISAGSGVRKGRLPQHELAAPCSPTSPRSPVGRARFSPSTPWPSPVMCSRFAPWRKLV